MMQRSMEAPYQWTVEHTEEAIRTFLVERDPDLVLLQELPGLVPYVESHALVPATTVSHMGNLAILVRRSLVEELVAVVEPGIAVLIRLPSLTIANVHLAPGPDAAVIRLAMVHQILARAGAGPLVMVGDTNMRKAEWKLVAEAGLEPVPAPGPTWDSRQNPFNGDGPAFTAYFTSVFRRGAVDVADLAVWTEPTEFMGRRFHLSDHYPLSGILEPREH